MPDAITFNLVLTAVVVFGLVYTVYAIHLIVDDASIIDLAWGAGFGLVAISLLVIAQPKTNYNVLLALLPILWAVRYTTFIFLRNWGKGEDDRYTDLRDRIKEKKIPWWLFSFFGVYGFSGARHVDCLQSTDHWDGCSRGNSNFVASNSWFGPLDRRIFFRIDRRPPTGDVQTEASRFRRSGI